MFGIPEISACASDEWRDNRKWHRQGRRKVWRFLERLSAPVREELICVQQYVRDQYDLAFNAVVDSFEQAVKKMGRLASAPSTAPERSISPVDDITCQDSPEQVRYLFKGHPYKETFWTDHMAMLGVSVLQEVFSWDSTTRLDFIRATCPFLWIMDIPTFHELFMDECDACDVPGIHSHWLRSQFNYFATSRMRAIGWIFWESPDRLASMSLTKGSVNTTYWCSGGIPTDLMHRVRSVYVRKALEPQDWEYIVREYGHPSSNIQLANAKSLFKSTGNLNRAKVAEIVSASRQQDVKGGGVEAKDNDE